MIYNFVKCKTLYQRKTGNRHSLEQTGKTNKINKNFFKNLIKMQVYKQLLDLKSFIVP